MSKTRTIKSVNGPETMRVTLTNNKEIVLTGVFNVMGDAYELDAISLEEDFNDLTLKDGESLEPFGPIEKITRRGDTLEYHYRRPVGFHIEINRDELVRALTELKAKPLWNPF